MPKLWRIRNGRINISVYMYFTFLSKNIFSILLKCIRAIFTHVLKVSLGIFVFICILSNNMLLYVFHVYFETIKLCTGLFSIYLHYYVMLYSHVFITQELWVRPPITAEAETIVIVSLQRIERYGCRRF